MTNTNQAKMEDKLEALCQIMMRIPEKKPRGSNGTSTNTSSLHRFRNGCHTHEFSKEFDN